MCLGMGLLRRVLEMGSISLVVDCLKGRVQRLSLVFIDLASGVEIERLLSGSG